MIAAVDVHYDSEFARAAMVVFDVWEAAKAVACRDALFAEVSPYIPGEFYLRELPLVLQIIEQFNHKLQVIVVDGYVDLDQEGRPGLGRKLFAALGGRVSVVGVAKSQFRDERHSARVLRGGSERPLFVTAAGMDLQAAAKNVKAMAGEYRLPTLLKLVDQLARGNSAG